MRIVISLVVIMLSLGLIGCDDNKNKKEQITFATSAEYPPFEFISQGEMQGFDIELAKKIAEKLDKEAVFKNMQFSAILPALQTNSIDAAIATITITPEREQNFDFSDPYYHESISVVSHTAAPLNNKNELSGKKIATQLGTTMEVWLKEKVLGVTVVSLDNNNLAIEALKANHVDGVVIDTIQATVFSRKNNGLKYEIVERADSGYGIAFPKDSPLREQINIALAELEKDGTIAALKYKWLEDDQAITRYDTNKTIMESALLVGKGIAVTLQLLGGAIVIGMILGTLFSISIYRGSTLSYSHVQKWVAVLITRIISIIRGTPLLLQLALVYFSFPTLFDMKLSVLEAGIFTFGINSSAYVAEILRAGIESLPKGQFEAAKTLQIPSYYAWKDIILPQVIRNILPAMVNEVIALLKETALIATIGGLDLMRSAQLIAAEDFNYFTPLCIAGVYYYVLVLMIEFLGKKVEKRGKYYA